MRQKHFTDEQRKKAKKKWNATYNLKNNDELNRKKRKNYLKNKDEIKRKQNKKYSENKKLQEAKK